MQRVLVTGAAKRLGRAIALELAAHGYDLAVHCRASVDEAQATAAVLASTGLAARAASTKAAMASAVASVATSATSVSTTSASRRINNPIPGSAAGWSCSMP